MKSIKGYYILQSSYINILYHNIKISFNCSCFSVDSFNFMIITVFGILAELIHFNFFTNSVTLSTRYSIFYSMLKYYLTFAGSVSCSQVIIYFMCSCSLTSNLPPVSSKFFLLLFPTYFYQYIIIIGFPFIIATRFFFFNYFIVGF